VEAIETTAWFILMLRHLFKTSRNKLFALSFYKIDWYHTATNIIRMFINIFFRNAKIEGESYSHTCRYVFKSYVRISKESISNRILGLLIFRF